MQAPLLRSPAHHPSATPPMRSPHRRPSGFTLVEMLVAMALTLIMVYAIAEFYAYVGDSVRDGRAMIEMGGQLRAASQRLKRDLDSLTVRVRPWTDDGNNSGYFEYYEGRGSDKFPDGATSVIDDTSDADDIPEVYENNTTNLLGDGDDIVCFTINSGAEPFRGRNGTSTAVSRQAEVAWWVGFQDLDGDAAYDVDEPRFLFRRQLLILPSLGQVNSNAYSDAAQARDALVNYLEDHDISAGVRRGSDGQYRVFANSLSDLTRREHRFAHLYNGTYGFPGPLDLQAGTIHSRYLLKTAAGEDIVLSNLLAFDVRGFDPTAPIMGDTNDANTSALALAPGDIGYTSSGTATLGSGAYVDLNYNQLYGTSKSSVFSGAPDTKSQLLDGYGGIASGANYGATYDTWAMGYERDGVNQDGDTFTDEGVDGVDNDSSNGVDDPNERETAPPYSTALRGVQVKIRIYDPSSRQVRQATVTADFVEE